MNEILDSALTLAMLTTLEIILGIDNLIFLTILSHKLPKHQQRKARKVGLTLAWVTRLLLLASAVWIVQLVTPLFHLFDMAFSGRDLFLTAGGAFLIVKSTQEIHMELEPVAKEQTPSTARHQFIAIVIQIAVLDIIFSLDSVLTAIGLAQRFWLMATAITIAVITMLFASEPISLFIERHPTIKMLALSFLILIGMVLVADGFEFHIPRGYIYFAMGFSLLVEFLNMLKKRL